MITKRASLPYNPHHASTMGLGSSRFTRRYSGNNSCSLFLRLLRCFTSAGSHLSTFLDSIDNSFSHTTMSLSGGFMKADFLLSKKGLVLQLTATPAEAKSLAELKEKIDSGSTSPQLSKKARMLSFTFPFRGRIAPL